MIVPAPSGLMVLGDAPGLIGPWIPSHSGPQGSLPQGDVDIEALAYTDGRALAAGPAFRAGCRKASFEAKVQVRACMEG